MVKKLVEAGISYATVGCGEYLFTLVMSPKVVMLVSLLLGQANII